VELSGGATGSPLLLATPGNKYPLIPTKPSLSARLENILTNVLAKLDSTSSSISAFLSDDNKAAFKSALADIATVSRTIAGRKDALDAGIANTARATAQLGPVIDRIGRSADAVEKMGNEAALASASAGKTIDAVGAGVKRFSADALPELERLLGEMNVLAASLRRLSEKVEGSPGGLLLGRSPVPPGPGEEAAKK
jgi:phospholipid/cholesterol/gamma-HCH transport system substrate-binding protein